MGKYSNEEIIKGIMERRSKILQFLYSDYLPMIRKYITKSISNDTEAEDLFQDTIIIIYEKIANRKLKLTSSFKTYFFAICRYLWLQRSPNLKKTLLKDHQDESWINMMSQEEYAEFEEEKLFQEHFLKLDKDCQKILLSYFEKKSYKEIAEDLNFKSSYIKKLKFNCKEKLYQSIINDPKYMELVNMNKDIKLNDNDKGNKSANSSKNQKNLNKNSNNENKKGNK